MVVILTMLKITAIVLIVLLSLILLLALAILLVPIRYRAAAVKETEKELFSASVVFSWLLHFVRLEFYYRDGLTYALRILGITVRSSEEKEKRKNKRKRRRKRKDRKKDKRRKPEQTGPETGFESTPEQISSGADADTAFDEPHPEADPAPGAEDSKQETGMAPGDEDSKQETGVVQTGDESKEETGQDGGLDEETEETAPEGPDQNDTYRGQDAEEEPGFFSRLSKIPERIRDRFTGLMKKVRSFFEGLRDAKRNLDFYVAFLTDDNTREQIENIKTETVKLLEHVKPKKTNVIIVVGSEDPEIVGWTLGALAVGQVFLNTPFNVTPSFEREVLDFDIMMRGRAVVLILLLIARRVFLNKGFKQMRRAYNNKRI